MTDRPPQNYNVAPLFAGTFYTPEIAQAHREALDAMRQMSSGELFETLVAAGIYAEDGTLRPPYSEPDQDEPAAASAHALRR